MDFDTSNSNIEKHKGVCMTFQKSLGKPIFLLACRHHVLLLNNVFSCLVIEKSKIPEIEIFKKIQESLAKYFATL